MKKMIPVVLFIGLISNTVFGQYSTGTKTLGGLFSYRSTTPEGGDAVTTMTVNPSVGYFVTDNIAVSVGLDYTKVGEADATTAYDLGGAYFMGNMYGGANYGSAGEDMSYLRLGGGYLHGLSESVFLDVNVGYQMGMGDWKVTTLRLGVGVVSFF